MEVAFPPPGIFPAQGLSLHLLCQQVDSLSMSHQCTSSLFLTKTLLVLGFVSACPCSLPELFSSTKEHLERPQVAWNPFHFLTTIWFFPLLILLRLLHKQLENQEGRSQTLLRRVRPSGCLAAQTKRWAEGIRVPGPQAGGGSTTARGKLRLCPASACQTGLPWSSPPA